MNLKKIGVPISLSTRKNPSLEDRLANSKIVLFLDYDGTLTPIVDDPSRAALSQETRKVLKELALLCKVVILSGRDVENLKKMIRLKDVMYIGSHGFDIMVSNGEKFGDLNWDDFLPSLNRAEKRLRTELNSLPDVLVERKRLAVAVHYRKVTRSNLTILKWRFNRVAAQFPSLKKTNGKKILELLPNVQWDKGKALISLVNLLDSGSRMTPIFIGDDTSDEDAFHAIKYKGIGIFVGRYKRRTSAQFSLRNYIEVRTFLKRLAQNLKAQSTQIPIKKRQR